jgi:hypothetical protein
MSSYGAKQAEKLLRRSIKTRLKAGMPLWIAQLCEEMLKQANFRVDDARKKGDVKRLLYNQERHMRDISFLVTLLWGWAHFGNNEVTPSPKDDSCNVKNTIQVNVQESET